MSLARRREKPMRSRLQIPSTSVATLIGSWLLPPPKISLVKGLRLVRGLEVLLLGINDLTATPASSNSKCLGPDPLPRLPVI